MYYVHLRGFVRVKYDTYENYQEFKMEIVRCLKSNVIYKTVVREKQTCDKLENFVCN